MAGSRRALRELMRSGCARGGQASCRTRSKRRTSAGLVSAATRRERSSCVRRHHGRSRRRGEDWKLEVSKFQPWELMLTHGLELMLTHGERGCHQESPTPHGRSRRNLSRYAVASPDKFLSYTCTIVGDGLIDRDTTAGAHGPVPNKFGRVGHAPQQPHPAQGVGRNRADGRDARRGRN